MANPTRPGAEAQARAARKAGIGTSTAYEARRLRPEFNRKWMQALCEGYDHLEMELLCRLRMGEVKPATGARKGVRTFDNATAFRLLAVHRETAARQRAMAENEDTEAILASIDAKLERMRRRRLDGCQSNPSRQDEDDARNAHPAPEAPIEPEAGAEPEAGHAARPAAGGTPAGTAPAD